MFEANVDLINSANNYGYDHLGNLTRDNREEIADIQWTVSGKVKSITRTAGSNKPEMSFGYGADGQRITKTVGDPTAGGYREYYLRDAQGNIMATYRYTNNGTTSLKVTDRPIYGSKRIGSYTRPMEIAWEAIPTYYVNYVQPMNTRLLHYELNDHLGNVTAVVTGHLANGNDAGSPWQADLKTAQGYEAGGSLLPGRNYSSSSYAYGFNGMRKDDEVYGATGTSYDFGARMYDPRIMRWMSLDPLAAQSPDKSPYNFVSNNPISRVDKDGRIDFEYTVSYRCNADKTYTKVINATAVYYVVNLTAQQHLTANQIPSNGDRNFSVTNTSPGGNGVNPQHADGTAITALEFNIDITYKDLKPADYGQMPNGANVIFVVDEVKEAGPEKSALAWANSDGQAIVSSYLSSMKSGVMTHEKGHNFGLTFEGGPDDGTHSSDPKSVMFPSVGGSQFPTSAMEKVVGSMGISGYQKEGTYHYGNNNAREQGRELLKDKAEKYNSQGYDGVTR
ncbi:MAG: hypothetical protein IPN44_12020 [Flavobacteriales bacterium]|nr:hypothetical protein [Flavobacteriales bacterium]